MKLIDEAFFIEKKGWGLWDSYDKENNKLDKTHAIQGVAYL